jgi:hypothetical protein
MTIFLLAEDLEKKYTAHRRQLRFNLFHVELLRKLKFISLSFSFVVAPYIFSILLLCMTAI